MHKPSWYKIVPVIVASVLAILTRPKRVLAPSDQTNPNHYPGTSIVINPGDLLFSPLGKSESKYVGHVGMLNDNQEVIHSIPSGLIKESVETYFKKFRSIKIFSSKDPHIGMEAANYLARLYEHYPKATYRVITPIGSADHEQYCTKIVWQAYFFGANVNLGHLSKHAKAIHPLLLKDHRFLKRQSNNYQ